MKHIKIHEARPGMVLARSIYNFKGNILLSHGITLSEEYIKKLLSMGIVGLFIKDPLFDDVEIPNYLRPEIQQQAFSVLSTTLERIKKDHSFSTAAIYDFVSSMVEDLLSVTDVAIHLTGIVTYDDYTFVHSLNCGIYTAILANLSGFPTNKVKEITCGALLHDIGKLSVELPILNKPGKLTNEEMNIMRVHPDTGFSTLIKKRWEISSLVAHMAWQHHERYDGLGYPRGLVGEEILGYARLLAITDVYEALTTDRPYRPAMPVEKAFDIINAGMGSHFDPEYCKRFLAKVAVYSPGMQVLLNTGEIAVVICVSGNAPRRPHVRVVTYPDGSPCIPYKDLYLEQLTAQYIVSSYPPQQNDN